MFDEQQHKHLDELLDSLLSKYSAEAPRPGLEMRILAGLRARTAKPRRRWTLAVAAPAAAVLLMALVMNWSTAILLRDASPPPAIANIVRNEGSDKPTVLPSQAGSSSRSASSRMKSYSDRPRLVEVVDAMQGEGSPVFEQQKLYLAPETEPEPASAREQDIDIQAPSISIHDLGLQPIAIKDLSPKKDIDEKGKL